MNIGILAALLSRSLVDGDGNHRTTAAAATLGELSSGNFVTTGVSPGDTAKVLLFSNATPAWMTAIHSFNGNIFYGTTQVADSMSIVSGPLLSLSTSGMSDIAVTDAPSEAGQRTVATVNGIADVAGFLVDFIVPDNGWLQTAGGTAWAPVNTLQFICNGVVVDGVCPASLGGANIQIPVILKASDYTQAMRDAGNIYESNGSTYVIVGVWEV